MMRAGALQGHGVFLRTCGGGEGRAFGAALHGGGQKKAPPGRGSAGGADALGEGKEFFQLCHDALLFGERR